MRERHSAFCLIIKFTTDMLLLLLILFNWSVFTGHHTSGCIKDLPKKSLVWLEHDLGAAFVLWTEVA